MGTPGKNNLKQKKTTNGAVAARPYIPGVKHEDFNVSHPLLWLGLAALIVYIPTFPMGLTDLDDGFIINTFRDFNENLHNLIGSFFRSAYGTKTDVLYRPIPADIMILNYQISNHGQNIMSYHIVNVLFHILAVILLYKLFRKLEVKALHAFILTLIFAVHPALAEAVAWIPARNETILAILIFSFLMFTIDYVKAGKIKDLVLSGLFLLLAFFSKETAVFAAPVAILFITLGLKENWLSRRSLVLYPIWAACFIIWFIVRSMAITPSLARSTMVHDFVYRLPLTIQYLGKMFLPFNLSVYPMQEDTVYYYGFAVVVILTIAAFLYKQRDMKKIMCGVLVFFLFTIPALLLPLAISQQTFEYRMYLPMAGIFFILPQTVLLQNKLKDKQLLMSGILVACLFATLNLRYQKNFETPLAFWTQAVETSPHSAQADMRLAARIGDEQKANQLFLKAFAINPRERFLNYIYGVMLQNKDSILESEKYFLAEKSITNYYECDLYLARIAMVKKDSLGAIAYLEGYLANNNPNKEANDNLLLLYLDTDQEEKAKAQAKHMLEIGLDVPAAVRTHFNL